jgi:plasmid stabilization system protein ParE
MTFEFFAEARAEFIEAALFYEAREPRLGVRFRNEVTAAIQLILEDPFVWRERKGLYRRYNLSVFPYYIAYFVEGDVVMIVAVAHSARRPKYWVTRFEKE